MLEQWFINIMLSGSKINKNVVVKLIPVDFNSKS